MVGKNLWHFLLQPESEKCWELEAYYKNAPIRYFSFGRYALAVALQMVGAWQGEKVLVPAFICRDLLAAIRVTGAEPIYYQVDKELKLVENVEKLPTAVAILAVNYFGFPQELQPFWDYCQRTGARLIEDNAHGLFSRDGNGHLLGTRGDLGIFSLRKTTEMIHGAALLCNNDELIKNLPDQLVFNSIAPSLSLRMRRSLKKIMPWTGPMPMRIMAGIIRTIRRWRTGHTLPPSLPEAERIMPEPANPCNDLLQAVTAIDVPKEIARRRTLYEAIGELLKPLSVEPIFPVLPEGTAPYLYPFYCGQDQLNEVRVVLRACGLEAFPWPELPDQIKVQAPAYYHNVWGVHFI